MLYYPPGRVLLIVVGLLHIVFSLGTFATSVVEISAITYSAVPLLGLPDRLPNISWTGHYALAFVIAVGNFALGVMAIKHRQHSDKAKLLLILSTAGLAVYIAFVLFSGYHEAYYRGTFQGLVASFIVPVLYIVGAGINFIAHLKHTKQTQAQ